MLDKRYNLKGDVIMATELQVVLLGHVNSYVSMLIEFFCKLPHYLSI